MECNKEEAMRAKDIAQKKMEAKDFPGARKFALKAQQLYPVMENITQMICVCDVHCSAESKMFGAEHDWYGILQVEQSADDTDIKKQYRRFALLLHPDKNKFFGAESAFKLIGEAQRVLLDKEKRSLHDMKRKTVCKPVRPNQPSQQQPSRNVTGVKTSRVQKNNASNSNVQAKGSNATSKEPQQAQSGVPNGRETFWTQCLYCGIRYQYYKEVLNRVLKCQSCQMSFTASDMLSQGARPGAGATQPVFPGQHNSNLNASNTGSEAMKEKHASNANAQDNSRSQKVRQSQKTPSKVGSQVEQGSKSSRKVNGKRGKKQEADSSDSFGSDSSLESEELDIQPDMTQQFDSDGDGCARRSRRNKRHVSYNEQVSDDEETLKPSKKVKESETSYPVTEEKVDDSEKRSQSDHANTPASASAAAPASFKESKKGECQKADGSKPAVDSTKNGFKADDDTLSSSSGTPPEPEFHEYPDPEFFDFDKDREEASFKVGQVWAAYDTNDAMPRFYAKIRKVQCPFKLRITWLEGNPDEALGKKWVDSDLPFSCGKFKYGSSEYTEDRLMFSHEVTWEKAKVGVKDCVLIYPRKGEIWGLFKDWDANWCSNPEEERKFEYQFVEVVSDYDGTVGTRVVELGKVKGFASLFCRKGEKEILVPPSELLKFSHKVPSYKMRGIEREGIPKDSFELDPASISMNLEEISVPEANGRSSCVNSSANFQKETVV